MGLGVRSFTKSSGASWTATTISCTTAAVSVSISVSGISTCPLPHLIQQNGDIKSGTYANKTWDNLSPEEIRDFCATFPEDRCQAYSSTGLIFPQITPTLGFTKFTADSSPAQGMFYNLNNSVREGDFNNMCTRGLKGTVKNGVCVASFDNAKQYAALF
jgi:hypothetical protein